MIIPHFYQNEAVQSIFDYFAVKTGNPVAVLPTGTGKSIVIALFCQIVLRHYANQRIIIATHVQELVEQNYEKLHRVWPMAPAGIFSAGLNRREANRALTFASIQSVAKKAALFGHIDLVMIDEAHLVSPNDATMYVKFIEDLKKVNPFVKVIGLTATPWRLGQGSIVENGSLFTDICYDISGVNAFNRLVEMGFLLPLITKRTTLELDTSGVHTRGGEFIEGELQRAVNKQEITYAALQEAMEAGHDRRSWLIFCAGIEHAEDTASMLTSLGIDCKAVHSKLPKTERKKILDDFKSGRLRAVTNNNVLTTGFDHPGLDFIIVLRPTQSTVLWVQMLGRGTRCDYAPGFDITQMEERLEAIANSHKQNCLVYDFAHNARRLGAINDPVPPRKKGDKAGEAPIKVCEECNIWNHASARFCGGKPVTDPAYNKELGCGAEFTFQVKIKQNAYDGAVMKNDLPVIEDFPVEHITYSIHHKADKPPMVKVSYYCKLKCYTEYVCPEHEGYAYTMARKWWALRTDSPMPASAHEMLLQAQALPPATHIRVHTNQKYPRILNHCFDGSSFGSKEASNQVPVVQVTAPNPRISPALAQARSTAYEEDDIPF